MRSPLLKFKTLFSNRNYILLLTMFIMLVMPSFNGLGVVDTSLFKLASHLLPSSKDSNEIQLIHLPKTLLSSAQYTQNLIGLIKHLSTSSASAMAFIAPQLPMHDQVFSTQASNKRLSFSNGHLSQLAHALKKYKVAVSLNQFSNSASYKSEMNISHEASFRSNYINNIPEIFLPHNQSLHTNFLSSIYPYEILPTHHKTLSTVKSQLVWWQHEKKALLPSLNLKLISQHLGSNNVRLQEYEGINLESRFIATDIQSRFYYLPRVSSQHGETKNSLSMERAVNLAASNFKNKIILMGSDYAQLLEIERQISSLLSGDIYTTPAWLFLCSQILLIFLFLYLMIMSRLQHNSAYFLSVLLVLLVTSVQYALLFSKQIWLPLDSFYIYILLGHFIVQLSMQLQYKINRIKQQSYNAYWKLGEYQYYQGDYDKALMSLIKCKANEDVLALLYEIGLNFERRRQYEKAANVYSEIQIKHKNYHDVKKRLHTLKNLTTAQIDGLSVMQSSDTLVLQDSGLQLPVLGRYEIEKELGRGAMGVVYLGKDPKINRQVAIKTLNYTLFNAQEIKAIKDRFFREAEAAGRLNHPNIVTVYDLGEEDDFAFITMDYVVGVSLGEYSHRDNLLEVNEVLRIAMLVAETLDYAHSQNIVHRDIKPSNIMYDVKTGLIKITDFGIARITDSVRTRTGSFMGSPSYMSPEQMSGQHVDGTSDVYALGVSMYQLLTGSLPYIADSLGNLAYKITHERHKPIREVRADLPNFITRIINKALQKDPQKRYQSGHEMAAAIKKNLDQAR